MLITYSTNQLLSITFLAHIKNYYSHGVLKNTKYEHTTPKKYFFFVKKNLLNLAELRCDLVNCRIHTELGTTQLLASIRIMDQGS